MLAIGRAMMRDPALLIPDEPTLGLAPAIVEDVLATVRSVAGGARAVLIADQNAAMVLPAADRAYLLQGGKAVAHGPAAALLADPALEQAMFGG
jgi:branched-chain amino acid transport system ATP-binding protein